uniref:Secreted protein n=1 Tax=Anguilla anguilla TaxID=7936 RepID=A0A0E9S5R4_ANGAN
MRRRLFRLWCLFVFLFVCFSLSRGLSPQLHPHPPLWLGLFGNNTKSCFHQSLPACANRIGLDYRPCTSLKL